MSEDKRRVVYDSLCLFLTSGQTFTFRDVEVLVNNQTFLEFAYVARSDGKEKIGRFQHSHVAGYSLCVKEVSSE